MKTSMTALVAVFTIGSLGLASSASACHGFGGFGGYSNYSYESPVEVVRNVYVEVGPDLCPRPQHHHCAARRFVGHDFLA